MLPFGLFVQRMLSTGIVLAFGGSVLLQFNQKRNCFYKLKYRYIFLYVHTRFRIILPDPDKKCSKTFLNIFFEKSILFTSTRRLDILCMCYVWGFNSLRFILKVMIPYLGLNKTVPVHKVASAREIVGELLLIEHVLRHKPLVVGILDEAQRQAVYYTYG